ncbi:GNAT family N-acetyltransferase [Hymenobacter busanensis]|uniref:GNAT family N-acetyltransferase n=1 Tax=Hymenobacter busanensis TaxID=2607656 RepID=A0A7L5A1N0_9BACT|nr:GNAT family N-acetyltransferase [Hymenobacter busanensis]KAA9338575.1 GNAT family N-acetyltransferase [Hymenobacter busanensis]QHJ08996.1 GNAT family N-acetyltransferase [Hymenobacter busanensis]
MLLPVPPAAPITTARLLLRPYSPADAPAFFAVLDADRRRLQLAFPRRVAAVRTLADAQQTLYSYAANWRQRRLLVWGIWLRESGLYLGDISLQPDTARARIGEIGYYLARSAEGHGYAREALHAIVHYAFGPALDSRQLILRCRPDNARSQATAEAVGFRRSPQQGEPGIWQYELRR